MTNLEDRPPPAVGVYWIKEEDYPALLLIVEQAAVRGAHLHEPGPKSGRFGRVEVPKGADRLVIDKAATFDAQRAEMYAFAP